MMKLCLSIVDSWAQNLFWFYSFCIWALFSLCCNKWLQTNALRVLCFHWKVLFVLTFRFAEAIQGLPFGQITSIWKAFCEEFKENYIKRLNSLNKEVSSKKKSKETSLSLASNIWKKLEYLTSIFNLFIVNISFGGIGEHLRGKPSVQSSQQLFRQCVKDVLEPLMDLASVKFKKKVRFMWRGRQFSVFSQGNSENPKATTFRLLVRFGFTMKNQRYSKKSKYY